MAYDIQIAVDCADPHTLADWWAETLGWMVVIPDVEFIRQMIAAGHLSEADTRMHNGALVFADGAAIRHPDNSDSGSARRVYFQHVPEPKVSKNRWHVDVRVGAENMRDQVRKLIERGATYVHDGRQGPHVWVTLADPEGNEFCVS